MWGMMWRGSRGPSDGFRLHCNLKHRYFFEVKHPLHTKAIGEHGKAGIPESVLWRHGNRGTIAEVGKQAIYFIGIFAGYADGAAVTPAELHAEGKIRGHQDCGSVAQQAGVDDAVFRFRRAWRGRVPVGEYAQIGSQPLGVALKGFAGVAVKLQVGVDGKHDFPLSVSGNCFALNRSTRLTHETDAGGVAEAMPYPNIFMKRALQRRIG